MVVNVTSPLKRASPETSSSATSKLLPTLRSLDTVKSVNIGVGLPFGGRADGSANALLIPAIKTIPATSAKKGRT